MLFLSVWPHLELIFVLFPFYNWGKVLSCDLAIAITYH